MTTFKPPFPYFGGKSRIAPQIWKRFGVVQNYVEPFFGSGAVMFANPATKLPLETVNDKDGFASNFWRAVKYAPEEVAYWADWPVNENDLHARHYWLVSRKESLQSRLEGDPDFYDAKVAGWWVWGISCWIGSGWCSGTGSWHVVNGELVNRGESNEASGVNRKRPHLGDKGRGVHRLLPYGEQMGNCEARTNHLVQYFAVIADRLRDVRVCCGDWTKVCGPCVTFRHGLTAVFLDPPYSAKANRHKTLYSSEDLDVANAVRKWCIENGNNPLLRIALCGYEGEHEMPDDWECLAWSAGGGYSNQGNGNGRQNRHRERVWFSPHCLKPNDSELPLL